MRCKVEKSKISGEITCPPNKSYTHRAIFLASLSSSPSIIKNVLYSADTDATINACISLGAEISRQGSTITVSKPIEFEGLHQINAENSGTTARITAGIAALSTSKTTIVGDKSLQKRPMQYILDALESLGATCTSDGGNLPVTIQGKVAGGEVMIPGNISSQFITSLLICAPLTKNGMTVNITGELVSKPYLDMTIAVMKKFNVTVDTDDKYNTYTVNPQQYKGAVFTIPPDYSSMALLLAAAVLVGQHLVIKALEDDLPQGDKAFLDMLKRLGVKVSTSKNLMSVKCPDVLNGGTFDLSDTPDLLPPLAILSLKCKNPLEICNVKHARYKETDRIAVVSSQLNKLGMKIDEKQDGMTLERTGVLKGAELDSKKDHRLFMAFCIAAMYVGDCSVTDSESVAVSYPNFVEEINKVGGNISV